MSFWISEKVLDGFSWKLGKGLIKHGNSTFGYKQWPMKLGFWILPVQFCYMGRAINIADILSIGGTSFRVASQYENSCSVTFKPP